MANVNLERVFAQVYFDYTGKSGASFCNNPSVLAKVVKERLKETNETNYKLATVEAAKRWLKKTPLATQLFKNRKPKVLGHPYYSKHADHLWLGDSIFINKALQTYNRGAVRLLSIVDCFSKFGFVIALKNGTSKEAAEKFEQLILQNNKRVPQVFRSDKGSEFIGKEFRQVCLKYQIKLEFSENKVFPVERFNQTICKRISKFITSKSEYNFVLHLQSIVDGYNNTPHSATGLSPVSALDPDNNELVKNKLFKGKWEKSKYKRFKFQRLDKVVVGSSELFQKSYSLLGRWNWPVVYETSRFTKLVINSYRSYFIRSCRFPYLIECLLFNECHDSSFNFFLRKSI